MGVVISLPPCYTNLCNAEAPVWLYCWQHTYRKVILSKLATLLAPQTWLGVLRG